MQSAVPPFASVHDFRLKKAPGCLFPYSLVTSLSTTMSSSAPAQSKKERDLDSLLRHIRGVRSLLTEAKTEGSSSRTRMLEKVKLAQVSEEGWATSEGAKKLTYFCTLVVPREGSRRHRPHQAQHHRR